MTRIKLHDYFTARLFCGRCDARRSDGGI